jgi:hypothetical protein
MTLFQKMSKGKKLQRLLKSVWMCSYEYSETSQHDDSIFIEADLHDAWPLVLSTIII